MKESHCRRQMVCQLIPFCSAACIFMKAASLQTKLQFQHVIEDFVGIVYIWLYLITTE